MHFLNKFNREIASLHLKPFSEDTNSEFWKKVCFAQSIARQTPWKLIVHTEQYKIQYFSSLKYSSDYPILQITFNFSSSISLHSIISSLCTLEKRKAWDTHLTNLEPISAPLENPQIIHSTFQYSYFRAELFEEKILATMQNSVLLGFQSTDQDYKVPKGSVVSLNHFTIYIIKAKEQKIQISAFLHMDPKMVLGLISKKIMKKKIQEWAGAFTSNFIS